ncbi:MAG: hypothetical protein NVS2B16_33880 [Chloroflexota bacterium]
MTTTRGGGDQPAPKVTSFIKCYGLRWQREGIFVGKGCKLIGIESQDKEETEVDFAAQTGVYALYDGIVPHRVV